MKLTIEWSISQRARYESDSSADVDNIVKPILDALSGPDGILVDDCQVQELICYWTGGLLFVHVGKGLYYPVQGDVGPEYALEFAEHVIARFMSAQEMVDRGMDRTSAQTTLPIQRVFHKSKIARFRTTTIEEMRAHPAGW